LDRYFIIPPVYFVGFAAVSPVWFLGFSCGGADHGDFFSPGVVHRVGFPKYFDCLNRRRANPTLPAGNLE
jgi:hypothetical protein